MPAPQFAQVVGHKNPIATAQVVGYDFDHGLFLVDVTVSIVD
jgi:hypothetical protein